MENKKVVLALLACFLVVGYFEKSALDAQEAMQKEVETLKRSHERQDLRQPPVTWVLNCR